MTSPDILVIDDQRTFRFDAVYARDAAQGVTLLDQHAWSEVWLDFDLGHGTDISPVLHHLEQRASAGRPVPIGRIYVHTSSPEDGERMVTSLGRWYQVRRVLAHSYLAPA